MRTLKNIKRNSPIRRAGKLHCNKKSTDAYQNRWKYLLGICFVLSTLRQQQQSDHNTKGSTKKHNEIENTTIFRFTIRAILRSVESVELVKDCYNSEPKYSRVFNIVMFFNQSLCIAVTLLNSTVSKFSFFFQNKTRQQYLLLICSLSFQRWYTCTLYVCFMYV